MTLPDTAQTSAAEPTPPSFPPRPADKHDLEAPGAAFAPKFDEHGLIPCITTDAATGEVLMFAFMNDLALAKTIETGMVHYWSRSRGKLWLKGESSGMTQKVVELLTDCDQDVVQARVEIGTSHDGSAAASCHVGYRNCFYRAIPTGRAPTADGPRLTAVQDLVYDPEKVYGAS
ncbi:MAG: phosphoribosyl-AMP cyclohydrolase [Planctomycetota bacterium]